MHWTSTHFLLLQICLYPQSELELHSSEEVVVVDIIVVELDVEVEDVGGIYANV